MAIDRSSTARHHARTYGDKPFDDFVQEFRRRLDTWDAAPWGDLIGRSGARYVVFVTKHEDGFMLWPSATTNPYKEDWRSDRDIVGEVAEIVRAKGLRFGVYYCSGLDWTFGGLPVTDLRSLLTAVPQSDEYIRYADAHYRELIERYEPAVLWNDMGYPSAADRDGLFAAYFDRVPDGVINDRFYDVLLQHPTVYSDYQTVEFSASYPKNRKWELCRGIGTSFGYKSNDVYEDAADLIWLFVDVVARGGNLLLNIGPTATGEIPSEQAACVRAFGSWLDTSGEAIYATRPWTVPGDGDVRFTATDDTLFAIIRRPGPRTIDLPLDIGGDVRARIVGSDASVSFKDGRVELPGTPPDVPAIAIALTPKAGVRAI